MKFNQVEATYICQLNKPTNRAMLEGYRDRKDKSVEELVRYYRDVISALVDTPAYGVSGVNEMLNKLTAGVRATLTKAKRGKISAPAHARALLGTVDFYSEKEATPRNKGIHKLEPLLTDEELQRLLLLP
jgi:hypothetical protein